MFFLKTHHDAFLSSSNNEDVVQHRDDMMTFELKQDDHPDSFSLVISNGNRVVCFEESRLFLCLESERREECTLIVQRRENNKLVLRKKLAMENHVCANRQGGGFCLVSHCEAWEYFHIVEATNVSKSGFPQSCVVSLTTSDVFLTTEEAGRRVVVKPFPMEQGGNMVLRQHENGRVSLELAAANLRLGLSPLSADDVDTACVLREVNASSTSMEKLVLVKHPSSTSCIPDRVAIQLCNGRFVVPPASGSCTTNQCLCSTNAFFWRIKIERVPVLDVGPLIAELPLYTSFADAPPQIQQLILQILRTSRDIGCFHIVRHSIPMDAFGMLQNIVGEIPFFDDHDQPDTSKLHFQLAAHYVASNNRGSLDEKLMALAGGVGSEGALALQEAAERQFVGSYRLSRCLLYLAALGQAKETGTPVEWFAHVNHNPIVALRALCYPPGPAGVITTSRHYDGTWLTMLAQDGQGGLFVKGGTAIGGNEFQEVKPICGALLVNWGNVLKRESNGFFSAVCHFVMRVAPTASRTRLSMPFFFDQEGSRKGRC